MRLQNYIAVAAARRALCALRRRGSACTLAVALVADAPQEARCACHVAARLLSDELHAHGAARAVLLSSTVTLGCHPPNESFARQSSDPDSLWDQFFA